MIRHLSQRPASAVAPESQPEDLLELWGRHGYYMAMLRQGVSGGSGTASMAIQPNAQENAGAGSDLADRLGAVRNPCCEPIGTQERLPVLDVLRGVALLGILVVNMQWFTTPQSFLEDRTAYWTEPLHRAVQALIALFAEMKFYSLFAMLFGAGIAMQYRKAEAAGSRMVPLHLRRMLTLLVLGALHAIFIWIGDILMAYAIAGLLSFAFCRLKPVHQLISALCLICLPAIMCCITGSVVLAGSLLVPGSLQSHEYTRGDSIAADIPEDVEAYLSRNYWDIVRYRVEHLPYQLLTTLSILPHTVGLFVLGKYVVCARALARLQDSPRWRFLVWLGLLALGGGGTVLGFVLSEMVPALELQVAALRIMSFSVHLIAAPMLAMFYAISVLMIYELLALRPIAICIAAAGRMSLSNYISQSLVCSVIFYGSSIFGWGMGLYAQVDPLQGLVLSAAIWAMQVAISYGWLVGLRMRYGPLEWAWRSLTYWQWLPLRA